MNLLQKPKLMKFGSKITCDKASVMEKQRLIEIGEI